ncbi:MAG: hypothetical protein ACYTXC_21340 [Nostoc sp.]
MRTSVLGVELLSKAIDKNRYVDSNSNSNATKYIYPRFDGYQRSRLGTVQGT